MKSVRTKSKILSVGISSVFVVAVLSLLVINPVGVFAQQEVPSKIVPNCEGPTCNFSDLMQLIVNLVRWAINIGLIAVSGIFAWAGILYLTAQGDPGKIAKAHRVFQKVFLGAVLALSAFVIIDLILTGLNVSGTVTSKLSGIR